jgi:NAD(P)-dependent dehydrogenase (short-subunit alcohol dehydrogenase family)
MERVCLLTGASGLLGSTFCRLFRSRYRIAAVWGRNPPAGPTQDQWFIDPVNPAATLVDNNHPLFAIQADLGDDRDLQRVVELVQAKFGRLDLLVNAAVYSVWAPTMDSNTLWASLEHQFRINTVAPLKLATLVARAFWRDYARENAEWNRNIVNVSSIAGLNIYPGTGQSVYSATKAALNHLTFHLAHEFWPFRVRVNATAPDSFPSLVSAEAVAQTIVRLDESDLNGRVLVVDRDGERLFSSPTG